MWTSRRRRSKPMSGFIQNRFPSLRRNFQSDVCLISSFFSTCLVCFPLIWTREFDWLQNQGRPPYGCRVLCNYCAPIAMDCCCFYCFPPSLDYQTSAHFGKPKRNLRTIRTLRNVATQRIHKKVRDHCHGGGMIRYPQSSRAEPSKVN